jgi:hypothetical protein
MSSTFWFCLGGSNMGIIIIPRIAYVHYIHGQYIQGFPLMFGIFDYMTILSLMRYGNCDNV